MRYGYGYGGYPPMYNQGLGVKGVLVVTALVIVFIIGIYFYMRKNILSSVEDQLPSVTTGKEYTPDEDQKVRYLAIAIKEDLSPFIQIGHNLSIYKEFLLTSDKVFVGIGLYYKQLAGESMRNSFTDSKSSFSINLSEGFFGESMEVYDSIISRMNALKMV
jgi:hypothetical protein